ncbi:MAG: serine/threonine protein kinase, partial [Chloroflexota bacterium]|nr:serine/threonine protein kinase [Chloroflexota bacterium]
MQQLQTTLPSGAILQDRYIVEDLLGQGGFGAVYLVRDQQNIGCFWALKEVMTQDRQEQQRLILECEMLKHLDHPALPSGQRVFEEDGRMYMLMEYIAGPNLEVLRKQQPDRRFSLSQVLALLEPVVEAVSYLHRQHPPLVHRDIKPANIIVSTTAGRTVLVDFGIAKEYYVDATTTAIRHCSPGYSAPEQYSSVGTDLRSDVYGLAATCYTLLTGTPPVDALQRMTKLASKGIDPLVSADILAPAVPAAA